MEDKEIKIEKDGIVHVIHVDENGKPIKPKNIKNKPKKKKSFKFGKSLLILFLVIFSSKVIAYLLTQEGNFTPGTLGILVKTALIYNVTEKEDYSFWKKLSYIVLIFILVEIGMFIISIILQVFLAYL